MKRGAGELFATHRVILIKHVIDPMDVIIPPAYTIDFFAFSAYNHLK